MAKYIDTTVVHDSPRILLGGPNLSFDLDSHIQSFISSETGTGSNLNIADGTVGSPSIQFDSDTDTGFYLAATGTIGVSIGGTKLFHFANNTFLIESGSLATNTIQERTSAAGVTIDGVLIKDGVYAFPASMTTIVGAAGNNAGTATVLSDKLNNINSGVYTNGVALPTSPLFGQEVYVANTSGEQIRIYSNAAGSALIVAGTGYSSSDSSVDIEHNEVFKFVFTDGKWLAEVIAGPSSTLRADVISERTGTAGVTIDGALIKDSAFDTNVAAAGVTLSGTTLAADGTDANIDITVTPKGSGHAVISGASLTIDGDGTDTLHSTTANTNFLTVDATGKAGVSVSADGMFADPETATEAGYITITVGATAYQIPFYASS